MGKTDSLEELCPTENASKVPEQKPKKKAKSINSEKIIFPI